MINIDLLKREVGHETFITESEKAKKFAPTTGKNLSPGFDSMIPHELSERVWDSELNITEKLKLIFQLYEEMPCYTYLMYIKHNYNSFPLDTKSIFWTYCTKYLLAIQEALSAPMEYSLWCDYFEDPEVVNESWSILINDSVGEELIKKILMVSGPVPYKLKKDLYDKIIKDKKWYYYIFKSLFFSAFDYFGNIDKEDAKKYFGQININNVDFESYKKLKEFLYSHV